MPLDVIMPALGMTQDTGVILAWHKKPGDPVSEGEALFDVETDKSAMEVEAQGSGYLTHVAADVGDEIPVGQVLARISETPDDTSEQPAAPGQSASAHDSPPNDARVPVGENVIMPALGMTQDAGIIVAWRKEPGDPVTAADILFDVETDKSVVEVPAGHDGYVAALLAEQGEEAPVGEVIAIISPEKPHAPIRRSIKSHAEHTSQKTSVETTSGAKNGPSAPARDVPVRQPAAQRTNGNVLASPKARRLALEKGLDLARLADHGHPQPYHVSDLSILESLAKQPDAQGSNPTLGRYLSAEVMAHEFESFANWAAHELDQKDDGFLLAGFVATSLIGHTAHVALEAFGETRIYSLTGRRLSNLTPADDTVTPDIRIRDLRDGPLTSVHAGPEDVPVISVLARGERFKLTLECRSEHMDASTAINLLSDLAGRVEQPLRHLL